MGTVNEERKKAFEKLNEVMEERHPIVQEYLESNQERIRNAIARGALPKLVEKDFLLVAQVDFVKE